MRQLALPVVLLVVASCGVEKPKAPYSSRVQALSNDLVISEVYGGGGTSTGAYRYDFIELFNRGSAPVSLSGKSLQYASETGTSWTVNALTGTVQPGRYFLVRMGSQGTGGVALPTADDTGLSSLSSTAGKVALVSNMTQLMGACPTSANIIDLVGYGMNTNCSEGMSTPNTTASSSVRRGGNGCFETDNNRNDFTVGTPTPKNAAAAAVNCANMPNDGGTVIPPSDGGCLTITSWATVDSAAGYQPATEIAGAELYTADGDAGYDILSFEAYYGAGLMLPATRQFTTGDTYGSCELCAIVSLRCDNNGTCAKEYFAQGGSGTVTVATQDEVAGRFEGSLSNVRLVEWDFTNDEAIPGGGCVVLSGATVSLAWDLDAGMGGGGAGGGRAGGSAGGGPAGGGAGGGRAGGSATGGGSGSTGGGSASTGGGAASAGGAAGGTAGGGNLTTKKACGCSAGADSLLALAGLLLLRRRR